MSPVTGLARLPGQILLSVHMGNFSPVDQDEMQETKPKW